MKLLKEVFLFYFLSIIDFFSIEIYLIIITRFSQKKFLMTFSIKKGWKTLIFVIISLIISGYNLLKSPIYFVKKKFEQALGSSTISKYGYKISFQSIDTEGWITFSWGIVYYIFHISLNEYFFEYVVIK